MSRRRAPLARWLAVPMVALLVALLAGCGIFGSDPQDAAVAFLAAVAQGDDAAAGQLTDDPVAATELISQVRAELKPQQVQLTVDQTRTGDRSASASFSAVWDLGRGRQWSYSGAFELIPARAAPANTGHADSGWLVRWTPAVLHPRLAAEQRVLLREIPAEPAPVVDRAGTPLLTSQTLVTVELDRSQTPDLPGVAAQLAAALQRIDPLITQESIVAGVEATPPGQRTTVVNLREQDYLSVRDQIHELPGVSFPTQQRLLGPDRGFASQLVEGIRENVETQLANAAGWRIVTVNALGNEVETLAVQQPRAVSTVTTTVDRRVQTAAERAVDVVTNPAMIVAIQPSTGEILAVAQNATADAQGPLALTGKYPPGSTFKIVTAAAALQAKVVALNSLVACPANITIGERVVRNDNDLNLGTVPLQTAFARSCNTTFAQLGAQLEASALTDAGHQMGIGIDYDIPGMTTITGEVPPSESKVRRAENGFGQGRVLTDPFGMALVASTVAAGGQLPTPVLIRGMPTQITSGPVDPVPREVADALRVMMREVVTRGTARALAGNGQLYGKTGTAEHSAGSHGWFVGFRGDLAFATLVVDAGSSGPALEVTGRFLSTLGAE